MIARMMRSSPILNFKGRNCLSNDGDRQSTYGVKFDEEQIKRKIKQIKQREQQQRRGQAIQKQNKNFMKNYQINKDKPKVLKFRKDTNTESLMNFQEVSLDDKPTTLQVTAYSKDFIDVDGFSYPPSVVLTPNQVLLWEITDQTNITPQSLKIVQLINPPPTYIIIGCNDPQKVRLQVQDYLIEFGINFDVVGMFQAISNFNTFAADQVNLIAFMNSTE